MQELATVKKPGAVDTCSPDEYEWRIREIVRCKKDIVYFAENYFRIVNLDKGLHVIKLYDVQKEFLRYLVENNKVVCCSGRQQGKSTIYCIFSLWYTTFFPEKKIMILANKASTAFELLGRIITAYEYLPSWLKGSCVTFNKGELEFSNMSAIRAFASSSDAARGWSANCLILDEFAFLQKNIADKLFTSVYPTISSSKNGKIIIVSTPNGVDNLYYSIWQQANTKESDRNLEGWKPFTMWWWQVPGHDEKWKAQQIAAIGEQRFAQEFNNEFLASSTTKKLIPDDIIEKHRIEMSERKALDADLFYGKKQKILNDAQDKLYEFTMWHAFDPKRTYLASGDCAEGVGGDSSVLYVWDVTDLGNITQCAKFSSNKVSTIEFAFISAKILKLYNSPWYICERNGVGSGYLDALKITFQYQNIVTEGKNREAGVFSHVTAKEKACIWAREMATTIGFGWTFHDPELIEELPSFVRKDTKGVHLVYQAIPPAHDDHILAWIWACWILQPSLVEKYFICCETFTSQLDKVYPKILMPQKECTKEEAAEIEKDPLYRDYLAFKEEVQHRLQAAMKQEALDKEALDLTQLARERIHQRDPFFGDYDDGPSWNTGGGSWSQQSKLNEGKMPSFYVF